MSGKFREHQRGQVWLKQQELGEKEQEVRDDKLCRSLQGVWLLPLDWSRGQCDLICTSKEPLWLLG